MLLATGWNLSAQTPGISFAAPLNKLSDSDRQQIVTIAKAIGVKHIVGATFKDRIYLAAYIVPELPPMPQLQTLLDERAKMSEAQRVARVTTDLALPALRRFSGATSSDPDIAGIKIVVYEPPDTFEVYVPLALLKQFVDAEITNQALMNGSIVLRNENRVEVSLK
jgi:hypothetical protein